jgi:hypothetical protein
MNGMSLRILKNSMGVSGDLAAYFHAVLPMAMRASRRR